MQATPQEFSIRFKQFCFVSPSRSSLFFIMGLGAKVDLCLTLILKTFEGCLQSVAHPQWHDMYEYFNNRYEELYRRRFCLSSLIANDLAYPSPI